MDGLTHYLEMIVTVANSLTAILGPGLMIREYIQWYREVHRLGIPSAEGTPDRA
jgi:hypothetical protein